MRALRILSAIALVGVSANLALAADPTTTNIPDGVIPATPIDRGDCANPIADHDGTDDTPGSGWTLGGPVAPYQYLGVSHTPTGTVQVDAVQFFAEFWAIGGDVTVHVYEIDDTDNAADAVININAGGNYEVTFETPICVDSAFAVMFCPDPGVWGVLGEDTSSPSGTSYFNTSAVGCELGGNLPDDLLVTSCVSDCGPTPTIESTWGTVKANYR
jgi:hypothetical protein